MQILLTFFSSFFLLLLRLLHAGQIDTQDDVEADLKMSDDPTLVGGWLRLRVKVLLTGKAQLVAPILYLNGTYLPGDSVWLLPEEALAL